MWSVVGCVSRGSGWGERVKFIGFSKLIEAHEGRGPLYTALSRYLSHARLHLARSPQSRNRLSGAHSPGSGVSPRLFFSPLSPLSLLSRDSRPRESTVDSHQEADQNKSSRSQHTSHVVPPACQPALHRMLKALASMTLG